jgi:hypothetical protein
MTKLISNKQLICQVIINLFASSVLVFIEWYTARFLEGILHYIGVILFAPSFFILFLLKGPTDAMHFTGDKVFHLVSFISYSLIIAVIQTIIFKLKRKKVKS